MQETTETQHHYTFPAEPFDQAVMLINAAYPDDTQIRFFSAIEGSGLTPAEFAVLLQVSEGSSYTQIGSDLGYKPGTVRNNLAASRDKLSAFTQTDVSSRTKAVITAYQIGLLPESLFLHFPTTYLGQDRPKSIGLYYSLTDAEKSILALISQGLTNPQIAQQLGNSEGRVKNSNTYIFDKLGVQNRVQATMCHLSTQMFFEKNSRNGALNTWFRLLQHTHSSGKPTQP